MSLINLPKDSQFKFYDEPISKKLIENIISKIDLVIHLVKTITDAASSFGKSKKIKNNYENTKLICDLCLANKKISVIHNQCLWI